jgi:hypothetical protein
MVGHVNVKFNMENIKMALKLLNPGLRPLGTYDLVDAEAGSLTGGEYVELGTVGTDGSDGYAADVGSVGPMGPGGSAGLLDPQLWHFSATACTSESLGGLCDEGGTEYGTLFGSLIGSGAGRATTESGAVVIGPTTDRGSGKVTVWHQHGLYGVNGSAATGATTPLSGVTAVNDAIYGEVNTGLLTLAPDAGTNLDPLGIAAGAVADPSLVSTTNAAAGLNAAISYWAVYFCGNAVVQT